METRGLQTMVTWSSTLPSRKLRGRGGQCTVCMWSILLTTTSICVARAWRLPRHPCGRGRKRAGRWIRSSNCRMAAAWRAAAWRQQRGAGESVTMKCGGRHQPLTRARSGYGSVCMYVCVYMCTSRKIQCCIAPAPPRTSDQKLSVRARGGGGLSTPRQGADVPLGRRKHLATRQS